MKNVFLTGEINIGKSTIIKKLLAGFLGSLAGFLTLPYYSNNSVKMEKIGYIFRDINDDHEIRPNFFISLINSEGTMVPVVETFETYGVKVLKSSLEKRPNLLIMDELGVFESKAFSFQRYVELCLSSKIPVLGVLKAKKSPFLDAIRSRNDVVELEVTEENRDYLPKTIQGILNL
ncbi:MAG: nucleoside-triphosphatase [Bacillota bacterium]